MTNSLIWTGLCCCLTALGLQLFPGFAFRIGAEPAAAWLVFGFGIFLMLLAAMIASGARKGSVRPVDDANARAYVPRRVKAPAARER